MTVKEAVVARFVEILKERNMRANELANLSGITPSTVYSMFDGRRKEITINLKEIAKAASFALKYGGRLCMLHRADRLAEVCYTLKEVGLEVKKIQFVGGRYGSKPYLVMVEAVKGGKPHTEILETIYNVK